MWEAFEHAAFAELDNLTAILDINRLGQRGETMHGWDIDSYTRRVEAFGWAAIEIDGHDVEAIDRAYEEARSTTGRPTAIVARTIKGKGVKAVENKDGWHGKALDDPESAIEELGGIRNIVVEVHEARRRRAAARVRDGRARAADVRARHRGRDAQGVRRRAARARQGDAATSSRSTARSSNSTYADEFAKAHPGALLRDVHRRAAAGRRGGRPAGARLEAVRVDVRGVLLARVRLRPHGRDLAGEHPPLGLARRRVDRRGRPVADGARGPRVVPRRPRLDRALPERREPDGEARRRDGRPRRDLVHPHDPRRDARHLRRPTTSSPSAARRSCARATT